MILMTLTWSSFVNGDEGLYKPKWWAVAFIKLPNYRGGSWSKITKFVSQFGWYEPSSPSTSYQRAPWLTFGALESAGNNFVVISCWRNFVFGFNSKSWLSKVLILISFLKSVIFWQFTTLVWIVEFDQAEKEEFEAVVKQLA